MKLRNKILLAICIAWLGFLVLVYAGSYTFLINTFLTLEQDRTNRNLDRIDQALDQMDYSLLTFTADWSHWDDLYHYLQGNNPNFASNNLNINAYLNSTINLLSYWDKDGHLIIGTAVDTDKAELTQLPTDLTKYVFPNSYLLNRKNAQDDTRGFILVDNKVMLVAASAITDANKQLPPLGTSIVGRYLSPSILKKIAKMTALNLNLYTLQDIETSPELQTLLTTMQEKNKTHFSQALNNTQLESYTLIKDINGKTIACLRDLEYRSVYLTGLKTIHYYLAAFVVISILFSLLLIRLLQSTIIKRLEQLDHDITQISLDKPDTHRVQVSGNDELSSVATEINTLMDVIQETHEHLENRIEQRTADLRSANTQLQQEITERQTAQNELLSNKEHLAKLAHYDHLTGLPNRVFFNELLNKSLSLAARQNTMLAVMFIDLDRFKNINDTAGHNTGDLVLKEIAHRLSAILRAGDTLARLGGDEFIVLLNDIAHIKFTSAIAEKLLKACLTAININGHEYFVSASIGICVFPNDGQTLEDLQRNADIAMYKAKQAGGSVFRHYTKDMDKLIHENAQLEVALRKAITQQQFSLHYQPKISLNDGRINGVEALIRWEDPTQGQISPARFIPIAEETGLIIPIGEWVLREACLANKRWQDLGYEPITIAVNLSAKQFRHQNIAQVVKSILKETQLDPIYLELEITETAMMDDVALAAQRLNELIKMGITISVDDFGTGHTSIGYLKQFPISILKIDQSFIKGVPHNANDTAITSAMIAMAHSLGLKVVAEGVETEEQLKYLATHRCDTVQGYFLSRPLPEAKIRLQFIKANPARKIKITEQE